ncbi:MAG: alpha/beta hydrolase [Lachnospiraceae bacterium]|nr:alpha/beta hydrolase [Lachnospiraceae bacterium]MBR1568566.1 alpha/beta hydrolase [Lachnospiraceae bacterium]
MHIHEFGDKENPVILLLPGTMCYWKGNFGKVIDDLAKDFLVAAVAYTGFDEEDQEDYQSVMDEVVRIEEYIQTHYGGHIRAAYGCSLGGTFVAHLAARKKIIMDYGIIGSSDMDQAGKFKASLMAALMVKVTWNYLHTGSYRSKLMRKRFERQMADPDPYNRAFVAMTGRDRYDLSFLTKQSLKQQFRSDLITPLPKGTDNGVTKIHIFYAKKMGEKYLGRYKLYFKDPVIHEHDMRHEEFFGVHPKEWCELVKQICLEG